jgi:hydroxymethylpyrimidine pyrophosphatase-like HAD family hydrolase
MRIQPTGYGDVLVQWSEMDKGKSGLEELARRVPFLPSLQNTVALGDGENDIGLFEAVNAAGGNTMTFSDSSERVREAAKLVLSAEDIVKTIQLPQLS